MTLWLVSVVLGLVVTVVVALLLFAIWRQAVHIEAVAADIWDGGTRIANNTVHVPDLARTNGFAERIVAQVPALGGALGRIRDHAEQCPGCPLCAAGGAL